MGDISLFSRIFAPMSENDRILIERLLNRDKKVEDDILELCDFSINHFISHYYEDYKDKTTLKKVLARELYYYFIKKDLLLKFEGKRGCKLSSYLNSIARFVLPRIKLRDSLIIKTKEKRKEKEDAEKDIIREFDNEPENFDAFKSTPIPNEFRDEDGGFDPEFIYVEIDEDGSNCDGEDDMVIEFNEIDDLFIDTATKNTIELVRETLKQMPPKESDILKKQFYEGYGAKELAEELGYTINVIYNLKSQAMRDFRTIYIKLKDGIL